MAIHSTPLLVPDRPTLMNSGAEVHLVECHNMFGGICIGVDPRELGLRGVALLVNLSTDEADRAALWSIRHALSFGRCSSAVFGGIDWPDRLAKRLKATEPQFVAAVIFTGCNADVAAETVQLVVDLLRDAFGDALGVLVVVSPTTADFVELRGVTGFIRGAQATTGETARQVFLALSVLLAPKTLNAIDVEHLLAVLGPASAPTVLAEALWLRDGGGRLIVAGNADRMALRASTQVIAVPLVQAMQLDELRRFHAALRSDLPESVGPIIFAVCDPLPLGALLLCIGWVPILCSSC
jgi:hypothetical protein